MDKLTHDHVGEPILLHGTLEYVMPGGQKIFITSDNGVDYVIHRVDHKKLEAEEGVNMMDRVRALK